ncbi:MAG: hypothetical protein EGR49_01830 [Prevotella sp.]|nr:hypothetical protein [Prevotella sp.]
MLVELQCCWEHRETDIFMFGTPFIPLAKIHCFLETNKFLSKKNGFIQRTPCFFKQNRISYRLRASILQPCFFNDYQLLHTLYIIEEILRL